MTANLQQRVRCRWLPRLRWARRVVCTALLVSCAPARPMSGFSERDARAQLQQHTLDACSVLNGRLVVEVEHALVREYPHVVSDQFETKKQPLLLLWVRREVGGPGAEVITHEVAPEQYRAGDPIYDFEGRRLLALPLRLAHGRRFDLRLAENNQTAEPEWRRVTTQIREGAGAAVPGASSDVIERAIDLLARLDKDDLILLWSADADTLIQQLGPLTEHRALRLRLNTTRKLGTQPSAELGLLVYLEPEPGCFDGARPDPAVPNAQASSTQASSSETTSAPPPR